MKKILKTKKFITLCILIVLLTIGSIWQLIMVRHELKNSSPPGTFVDVGTYKAHCYTKGEGEIAFVFITGSGTPLAYSDFYLLQDELSHFGQTISFDHAGSGWSTPTTSVRTIDNLNQELSAVIDALAPGKPIVLLCHSLGSLEAIHYAQVFPEKVKGIVFFDSGSPELYSKYSEFGAFMLNRSLGAIRTIGLNRILGESGLLLPMYGENLRNHQLPREVKKLDKLMYYKLVGNPSSLNTIKHINENAKTVLAGDKLRNTPILVLSSDNGSKWNDDQLKLAAWSTNNKQVKIKGGEHYIYWSNVKEVLSCIKEYIEEKILGK